MLRIAWGITGCGDQIEETFGIMNDLSERYDLDISGGSPDAAIRSKRLLES
jgi:flavoprotein